jgi:hypothetical protein
VNPVSWDAQGESDWWIRLRCGECDLVREVEVSHEEAKRFEVELDRGMAKIASTVAQLDRERMVVESDILAAALERDLIDPAISDASSSSSGKGCDQRGRVDVGVPRQRGVDVGAAGDEGLSKGAWRRGPRAGSEVPVNSVLNVANGTCTKTPERFASPGVVLPLLLAGFGGRRALGRARTPAARGGVAARSGGVGSDAGGSDRVVVLSGGGGVVRAVTLLVTALAAAMLEVGRRASSCSGCWRVPPRRRRRHACRRGSPPGSLGPDRARHLRGLIAAAAALWALGAWLFAWIRETPGATAGGRTPLAEARAGARLLRDIRRYPPVPDGTRAAHGHRGRAALLRARRA